METDKALFKEELAGTLKRRIFKATLEDKEMILDIDLKLIIPLRKFTTEDNFADKLSRFIHMSWRDTRREHGTLEYKNVPILERVAYGSFYLLNGWRIYAPQRKFMRFAGWVEADEANNMTQVFNFFVPDDEIQGQPFIEVTYKDGTVVNYDVEEKGFLLETRNMKRIMFCYNENAKVAFSAVSGFDASQLSTRGYLVKFQTGLIY